MIKINKASNPLERLQHWYLEQCNGDWEHQYGVKIDTLDNPGWDIEIDIRDTYLIEKKFSKISIQREKDNDWFMCWVNEEKFVGSCGPQNLGELINVFLDWADDLE